MNELANGTSAIALTGMVAVVIILGLIAWYFVNRASVKANAQIRLLEALLEEQKRQNQLLGRLTDKVVGEEQAAVSATEDDTDFTRLIPER